MKGKYKLLPRDSPIAGLLSRHDAGHHICISHLDRSPVSQKQINFAIALFICSVLSGLMTWRVLTAKSHYAGIAAAFGLVNSDTVDSRWYWMLMHALIDYQLYSIGWHRLRNFVVGQLWHRVQWGFRPTEIILRRPTAKQSPTPPNEKKQVKYATKLNEAVDPSLVYKNIGVHTATPFWGVDFKAMGDAYQMLKKREIMEEAWDLRVWTFEDGQWTSLELWRLYDNATNKETERIIKDTLRSQGRERVVKQWDALMLAAKQGDKPVEETLRR
ncbi:hypothetical protein BD779DRAFT_705238 [Infundibulicybe gibba]|nr:hypothetical protein BD779DRAFT_705238 [Infundibulicybe gibba]